MSILKFLILIVSVIVLYFVLDIFVKKYIRSTRSKKYFELAENKAKQTGKKLMIIGDPCQGHSKTLSLLTPDLHHGDVTIDLYGCNKCNKKDINNFDFWRNLNTNEYVVFETSTISFSKDIDSVVNEINRISGGDFYSGGSTDWIIWEIIAHLFYSNLYETSVKYRYPPYNSEKDSCFKYKYLNTRLDEDLINVEY